MSSGNHIPRKFNRIVAELLIETNAGKPATYHIYKNDNGYLGININTGKRWCIFPSHLKNPAVYRIISVE